MIFLFPLKFPVMIGADLQSGEKDHVDLQMLLYGFSWTFQVKCKCCLHENDDVVVDYFVTDCVVVLTAGALKDRNIHLLEMSLNLFLRRLENNQLKR